MAGLQPSYLRTEYKAGPLGLDTPAPRLSWVLDGEGRGRRQTAYEILVASTRDKLDTDEGDLWASGRVRTDQQAHIVYGGAPLRSRMVCWWKVRVWDEAEQPGAWSIESFWTMGLLEDTDWQAQWIGCGAPAPVREAIDETANDPREYPPCPYLRSIFTLTRPIERATIYASALGLYELRLNGEKVGEDSFTPGWTDYRKRVYYQTYDVTEGIRRGENALGVVLGHGWYSGYLGWETNVRGHYGKDPRVLVQLELEYADGSTELVVTDQLWRTSYGAVAGADLYLGERYDARREMPGWDEPGFDDSAWHPACVDNAAAPLLLQSYPGVPVQAIMELPPVTRSEPAPGVFVFDLGQNMVGWARLRVTGPSGSKVRLRFAEMLNPDGTIYVTNLRSARSVDEYWTRGDGEEVWEPRFTFHGFRYIEVTGYPGTPALDAVTGIVAHSNMARTGHFECSDEMLNQLQHNIEWSMRGNFLEVPTDCPQRDERLGWMGDAQVFAPTACFNMDTAAFFTKWLQDVEDAQSPEGAFSDVSPRVVDLADGAPAWADAGVIVPWVVYQSYGDTAVLARHYDAMRKWVDFLDRANPNRLWLEKTSNNFGDWLSIGEDTPKEVISTAYFARCTGIVAQVARELGREADAAHYQALWQAIRDAFNAAYVDGEGRVHGESQTAYGLALEFGLLPERLRPAAVRRLIANVEAHGNRLTTGFVGCPLLLSGLSNGGAWDTAYALLQSHAFPSWGYTIDHGATTIWERWDGWTHDKGFQDPCMNSFNHYAFGAAGDWMYRNIGGIALATPGCQRFIVRPRPGGSLVWAKARYDSMHGAIQTEWRLAEGLFSLTVSVPVNALATVYLLTTAPESVREGGNGPAKAEGVVFEGIQDSACVYSVSSGQYRFVCPAG